MGEGVDVTLLLISGVCGTVEVCCGVLKADGHDVKQLVEIRGNQWRL